MSAVKEGRLKMANNFLFNKYFLTDEERQKIQEVSINEVKEHSNVHSTKDIDQIEKDLSARESKVKKINSCTYLV